MLYRLTSVICAPTLSVCTDIKGAVLTTLGDTLHRGSNMHNRGVGLNVRGLFELGLCPWNPL